MCSYAISVHILKYATSEKYNGPRLKYHRAHMCNWTQNCLEVLMETLKASVIFNYDTERLRDIWKYMTLYTVAMLESLMLWHGVCLVCKSHSKNVVYKD